MKIQIYQWCHRISSSNLSVILSWSNKAQNVLNLALVNQKKYKEFNFIQHQKLCNTLILVSIKLVCFSMRKPLNELYSLWIRNALNKHLFVGLHSIQLLRASQGTKDFRLMNQHCGINRNWHLSLSFFFWLYFHFWLVVGGVGSFFFVVWFYFYFWVLFVFRLMCIL